MRMYDNGVYRDATTEEVTEFERQQAEMPEPEPTPEERLAALESAMLALMGGAADV